jgi:hypothetical protein
MKKNNIKKKTELQEIEEFLLKEGFREVTKKELREMYHVKPVKNTPARKTSAVKKARTK